MFAFVSCGGTRSSSRRLVLLCDFFLARSARRLCTHVNHGIKQLTRRCIEVKCLCIHMLAGLLDTNFDDCGGREEGCVQTLCCAFVALFVHSTPRDASDPRHGYTFDIHYSRRLTMCGHLRWKGTVNYQYVVPKGQGASFLGLQGGHRTRCN